MSNTFSFKPCYKWNTFNTPYIMHEEDMSDVLNLVISGIPSIRMMNYEKKFMESRFKPCYKWNTFNTSNTEAVGTTATVGFKPCYKWNTFNTWTR